MTLYLVIDKTGGKLDIRSARTEAEAYEIAATLTPYIVCGRDVRVRAIQVDWLAESRDTRNATPQN